LAKNKTLERPRALVSIFARLIFQAAAFLNATRATLLPRAVGLLLNFAESWTARGPAYWRGMASGQHLVVKLASRVRRRAAGRLAIHTPAHCIC
jgi:hypothetical protein